MVSQRTKIKQSRKTDKDVNVPPGYKVACWIPEIIDPGVRANCQPNPNHISKPAQIRTTKQEARFLWKAQAQIDQSAAAESYSQCPKICEIVRSVEVEKSANPNCQRGRHHGECTPGRFGTAQAKDPQTNRKE